MEQAADYLGARTKNVPRIEEWLFNQGNEYMTVYVFDSGPLIDLFRHYYRDRFPLFVGSI